MNDISFLSKQLFNNWNNWVEIIILWILIYYSIMFIKGTRTFTLIRGALFLVAVYWLARTFNFTTINMLFDKFGPVFLIGIIVLFAPEMRRALTALGQQSLISTVMGTNSINDPIKEAVRTMANTNTGALIAIEKTVGLRGYTHAGVALDALVSAPALMNIFYPKSPMHDGGVIIEAGRIVAAACIFPLSSSPLSHIMGTRHRAALGISEETDALVICVSEETGKISLFENGKWDEGVTIAELIRRLSEDTV